MTVAVSPHDTAEGEEARELLSPPDAKVGPKTRDDLSAGETTVGVLGGRRGASSHVVLCGPFVGLVGQMVEILLNQCRQ